MTFSKPLPENNSLWREVLLEYSRHDTIENEEVKRIIAERIGRKLGIFKELEAYKNEHGQPRNRLAYKIGFYELPYLRKNGFIEYVKPRGYGKITQKGKDLLAGNFPIA